MKTSTLILLSTITFVTGIALNEIKDLERYASELRDTGIMLMGFVILNVFWDIKHKRF